jgi:uncharacterized protein (UPF0210 family)
MIEVNNIVETIKMIEEDHLDIRTITMGISLLNCADSNIDKSCEKVYNKVMGYAKNLVPVANQIQKEFGIPIINKRISVTPISMLVAVSGGDPVKYALALEKLAVELNVDFIGGYSALCQKGFSKGDIELINSIPQALDQTDHVCSSVNIGTTRAGINMDAVKLMGEIVRKTAEVTQYKNCIGAAKLVVFCNAVEDNPFMAGAFHGVGEPDCEVHVGVSGPGVVREALSRTDKSLPMNELAEIIKKVAKKRTGTFCV